jgi:hypothetical protein
LTRFINEIQGDFDIDVHFEINDAWATPSTSVKVVAFSVNS